MKEQEQKNFVDFISDACKSQTLLTDFLKVRNTPGVQAETLKKFFDTQKPVPYNGVSLVDCEKLVKLPSEIVVGMGQKY